MLAKILLALGLAGLSAASPIKARQYGGKRGLAFNVGALTKLFPTDKVTWMYNWDSAIYDDAAPNLQFVPMLHSDKPEHTGKWGANIEAAIGNGATALMSFNEPDQCGGGGACMQDPGATAAAHRQWIQPVANAHPNVKIGAPAVTNGVQAPNGSPMGIPYLQAFLGACSDCKIDFVVAHWYDDAAHVDYFKQHLTDIHNASGGKEVWLTEFGATGDAESFLREVLPWMDSQDWITHYAYQWAAPGIMVTPDSSALTSLGATFASA